MNTAQSRPYILVTFLIFMAGCSQSTPPSSLIDTESLAFDDGAFKSDIKAQQYELEHNNMNLMFDDEDDQQLSLSLINDEAYDNSNTEVLNIKQFSAKDENKDLFFHHLSQVTGENYIINPGIPAILSINLNNTNSRVIRLALEKTYDIQFTEAGKSTWVVEPKRPITKFYHIDHVGIKRSGTSSMNVSSQTTTRSTSGNNDSGAAASLSTIYDNSNFWANLKATVNQIIGNTDEEESTTTAIDESSREDIKKINDVKKKVTIDENLGIMAVTAFKDEHENVRKYLDSIQEIASQQVIIEAKILQVTLDKKSSRGLNLSFEGSDFGGKVNLADPDQPILSFSKSNTQSTNDSFNAAINYLEKQGKVEVISSPKISAMNNQLAVIKVGEERYFATQSSSTDNTSNSSNTTNSYEKEALFSGIAFYLVPSIVHDEQQQRDLVTIHLRPSTSSISTEKTLVTSSSDNNANNNKQASEIYLNLPKISTTQVDTIVRLFDNETAVIGGLTSEIQEQQNAALPHGPKTDSNQYSQKIETVILLKAHIVNDDDTSRSRHSRRAYNRRIRG